MDEQTKAIGNATITVCAYCRSWPTYYRAHKRYICLKGCDAGMITVTSKALREEAMRRTQNKKAADTV